MRGAPSPPNEIIRVERGVATFATYTTGGDRRPEVFVVDEDDLGLVQAHRWSVLNNRYIHRTVGATRRDRKSMILHREIARPEAGHLVDHVNGDGFDNRRCNLRVVTPQQNTWNRGTKANTTTGRRGVQPYSSAIRDGFRASISLCFSTLEEAIAQRERWEAASHGEFRRQS